MTTQPVQAKQSLKKKNLLSPSSHPETILPSLLSLVPLRIIVLMLITTSSEQMYEDGQECGSLSLSLSLPQGDHFT